MSSFDEEYRPRRPNGDDRLSPAGLEERRQLALDRLTEAYAQDLITMDGYERRVSAIQRAAEAWEIDGAVADLPAVRSRGQGTSGSLRNRIDSRLRGEDNITCVMGNRNLQGDWLQGDRVNVFAFMGSTRIDLRDTVLPPGRLKLDAFCLMGDIKVVVPEGLPVKMNALPIMANSQVDRSVDRRVDRNAPWLDIEGLAFMGNIVVTTA